MIKTKRLAIGLAGLALAACAVSCSGNGDDVPYVPETETVPPTYELETEYHPDYEQMLDTAFGQVAPAPASSFTFEDCNGGVRILTCTDTHGEYIKIPDTLDGKQVVAIGDGAFSACTAMTALDIPASVTEFGKGILEGCKKLNTLRTPAFRDADGKMFVGYLFGADSSDRNATAVPATLENLILLSCPEQVDKGIFYRCKNLVFVALPEGVREIDDFAFANCESLAYLHLPDGLTRIGDYAFLDCLELFTLQVPNTVTEMGRGMLEGCAKVTDLTLPFVGGTQSENTYLGYLFGAAHYEFSKGYMPLSLAEITVNGSLTALPDNAFFECATLCRVNLPDTLTSVGLRAFYGCERLQQIALPDGVTTIGDEAFYGCIRLESAELGSSLTSLGIQSFYGCLSLKQITLPDTLTTVSRSAFAKCQSLCTLTFGGVTKIEKNAFLGCIALTSVPSLDGVTVEDGNDALNTRN